MTQQQTPAIPTTPDDLKTLSGSFNTSGSQLSAAGTTMSTQVQGARVSNLKRVATAAIAVYGAKSTEAAAAKKAVTAAQVRTTVLQAASQKVGTTPPDVAATGWALHGRVYDASLNPQERFTVFLIDAQKRYLSDYGYSYTDSTGYFLINFQGASPTSNASDNQTAKAAQAKSRASKTQFTAFIQVTNTAANPVLLSTTPFVPVTGQAQYQTLTLPASNETLGDPPAEVRETAMPSTQSEAEDTESDD